MSATAYAEPLILPAGTAPTTEFRRPPLRRLAAIELRKMTDTRSGFWLMLTVAALAIGLAALQLIVAKPDEQTGAQVFIAALLPVGSLLPVVGILAAAATPVGSGFDLTAGALLNGLLFAVISISIGVAFGMLFQTPRSRSSSTSWC